MTQFAAALSKVVRGGKTAASLAQAAGISAPLLSRWMQGEVRPTPQSLEKLAAILDDQERAEVVFAHLCDEIPECSRHLLIVTLLQEPGPQPILAKDVETALRILRETAVRREEVAEWLVLSADLIRDR